MRSRLRPTVTTRAGFALVAVGAALWGTDALFRTDLAQTPAGVTVMEQATAVVAAEHLVLVVLTVPLLVRGLRQARATFDRGDVTALVVVGGGASVAATALFTAAFTFGDPNTPLLLQQLQPVFAVLAARLFLGEKLLRRYPLFFVAAVAGAWLVAFKEPLQVGVSAVAPALLAAGAALLWALGTVLGRWLTAKVGSAELAALRFAVGLPLGLGLAIAVALLPAGGDGASAVDALNTATVIDVVLLALLPGLFGMLVYYRGLRGTPASSATLAELAFPVSSVLVNYLAFGATLDGSQWAGLALLAGTILVMSAAHGRGAETVGVAVTDEQPALVSEAGG